MTTLTLNPPGTFCWIELGTPDVRAARAFYEQVFGWSVTEMPMGEGGAYFFFQKEGKDVAAMYQLSPEMLQQGIPPHWLSYVAVTDADAMASQAASLGATVMMAPFDVGEHGRMAVLKDPQDGAFALWQAKAGQGIQLRDEPGALAWSELTSTDIAGGSAFYTALFGWEAERMPMPGFDYTVFKREGQPVAGGMARPAEMEGIPTHWMPYFAVEDADATLTRAKAIGAQAPMDVMAVEGVGRFVTFIDPTGAAVSVLQAS